MSWGPDLQDEIPNAKKPEAGRHGNWEHQEAPLTVLPAQGGALPDWAVPQLDEEPAHPECWYLHLLGTGLGGGQRGACNVPRRHDLGI